MTAPKPGARPRVHIEDVVFIIEHGGTWESTAARLGITVGGVDKKLRAHGRLDLVEVLSARSVRLRVA